MVAGLRRAVNCRPRRSVLLGYFARDEPHGEAQRPSMSLLTLIVFLVVVGVVLWAINAFLPMDAKIKLILNVVIVLVVVLWLLRAFGLLDRLDSVKI